MNISYSTWKCYRDCPKLFWYKEVARQDPPIVDNEYFTLYGTLIQKFFELYCNSWALSDPKMKPERVRKEMEPLYQDILSVKYVDWNAGYCSQTGEEIFEDAVMDTCKILESPTREYFLSTRSEITLKIKTKQGFAINGRLDFIHTDPKSKTSMVIDGKGTNKLGKNIDKNQIYFYNLLYFLHYKALPLESGIFYYRFNIFDPIEVTMETLNEFRAIVSVDLGRIANEEEYKATPSNKSCKYCLYKTVCEGHAEWSLSKAKKRKSKSGLKLGNGIQEFGF